MIGIVPVIAMFRIALAQINPSVGDFEGNTKHMREFAGQARDAGVDLLVFPELALSGYPPEDLLLKPHFLESSSEQLQRLTIELEDITTVIGCPFEDDGVRNAAIVTCDGGIIHRYYKQHLPNYGVFDEKRYFIPGSDSPIFSPGELSIGISICEDIWIRNGPVDNQARQGAELLINISASPYHTGKTAQRAEILSVA